MESDDTGLILRVRPASSEVVLVSSRSRRLLRLGVHGYVERFLWLLDACLWEGVPVFLGGRLELGDDIVRKLREFPAKGSRVFSDASFLALMESSYPGDASQILLSKSCPSEAYPITWFSLVRDQAWRIHEELALPLPRRVVVSVEEPCFEVRSSEGWSSFVNLFLDSGGHVRDLVWRKSHPPSFGLSSELFHVFPHSRIVSPPTAAIYGLLHRESESGIPPQRHRVVVHAGETATSACFLSGDRVRAWMMHDTRRLCREKIEETVIRMGDGARLDSEVYLDGGCFAHSRIFPGEAQSFAAYFAGVHARRFQWDGGPEGLTPETGPGYDLETEGLVALC